MNNIENYKKIVWNYCSESYKGMFREPQGFLKYPFIVPGDCYGKELWDWDSWLTNIAIRQIITDKGNDDGSFYEYEKGSVLNFLINTDKDGKMPINISPDNINLNHIIKFEDGKETNMHKPCLAQHIAFILKSVNDDTSWLEPHFDVVEKFIKRYKDNNQHKCGLYFWTDDFMIGVDNDPCAFYRPDKSSGSIYLNCLMFKELEAMAYICEKLKLSDKADFYRNEAENLKNAVSECCWDERMGFFFSVDFNLLPVDKSQFLHSGAPRHWDFLIQRIESWTGFMALWAGIATKEQAQRIVKEHFYNEKTFSSPSGIRSLAKTEKMYTVKPSGNPSCWLGPIWGIANYMVFKGLLKYGYEKEAVELAQKTVEMFGKDIENCGKMHEYYSPETGEPVHNIGFQSWNFLVCNMIAYLDNKKVIEEF